ncbi:ABC transporter permease [uncultured Draconibacterium sp.]|uniref:ABC transporter permease n=1 Tax=uncultured Draconibacterium sp. TaxID=1573823 RepID=UPI0032605022
MNFQDLKIAFRNAKKHSVMTFAKLFGLTLSFAVIVFAAVYAYYETSFDNMYPDKNRIYRVIMYGKLDGREADMAVTTAAMGKSMVDAFPELEDRNRIRMQGNGIFVKDDHSFRGEGYFLADTNFFAFWGVPILTNRTNALGARENVTIARSLAERHFNSVEQALEKPIKFNGNDCIITGVFEDFPPNSHLQGEVIRSINVANHPEDDWGSENLYTYFKTYQPIANLDDFTFKTTQMVYHHRQATFDPDEATTLDDLKYGDETYLFYRPEPLKKIHFGQHRFDNAKTSNKIYVYGAIVLALLVLVISSVNYINLSIANIVTRHKEIAVRKTNGAFQNQLIKQFITEALLYWFVSLLIALILYFLCSQYLLSYLGLRLEIEGWEAIRIVGVIISGLLVFNLLINIWPVLSASRTGAATLLGSEQVRRKKLVFSNVFVIVQFAISALIIISAILVNRQIDFMVNKDRGYDPENVMMITLWDLERSKRESLIEELRNDPNIKAVTTSDLYFGEDPSMNSCFFDVVEEENYFHTSHMITDPDFMKAFDVEMVEGRFFSNDLSNELDKIVVNETVAAEYGKDKSILGKTIVYGGGDPYEVIGVIKDFNFRSLHHKLAPLVIRRRDYMGNIFIKINQDKASYAVDLLKAKWSEFNISRNFYYTFHNQVLVAQYEKDRQARKMMTFLSIISIIIACTGLYAISNYTIQQKTKEVAIRKINGATVLSIANKMSKRFLALVVLSFVLVLPLSIYLSQKWLENFAYQTSMNGWIFMASLGILILVSLLAISIHVIGAATRNPVEALRYE